MKKVCVLLSTYNGNDYFTEQIESLISQKNIDIHISIRDDGSNEQFKSILANTHKKYEDIIDIDYGENVGFASSFYKLVLNSHDDFDFYAFSDQDDVWLPDKISKCVDKIENSDVPQLCFCNSFITDSNLVIKQKCYEHNLIVSNKCFNLFRNPAQGCSMVFNKEAKRLFLQGNPKFIEYHDHWLYVICSFLGKIYYIDEPLFYYRQHGNNQVGVASSLSQNIKHKKSMLKKETHYIQKASSMMIDLFSDRLSHEELDYLSVVCNYRKSFRNKIRLLRNKEIKKYLKPVRRWFIIRVLFNKV